MRSHTLVAACACLAIVLSLFAGCGDDAADSSGVAVPNNAMADVGVDASERDVSEEDASEGPDRRSDVCERDEYVLAGECTPCPPGTSSNPGDRPEAGDTSCKPIRCAENERVLAHECVPCEPGTFASAGGDASQGDTQCVSVLCGSGLRVVNNECVSCEEGTRNESRDDSSGPDTTCDPIDHCADQTDDCAVSETCEFTGPGTFDCIQRPFISTWITDNLGYSDDNQILLPLVSSGTYDFTVDWGDGTTDTIDTWDQAEATHTYAQPGIYTIEITGTIKGWAFSNEPYFDLEKLVEVNQWGVLNLGNSGSYFQGARNLRIRATDQLDLEGTTNMRRTFRNCESLTTVPGMQNWDVSGVADMEEMFSGATAFNQDLSPWDVSNVTNMAGVFAGAAAFDQDLSPWDVSNVTNMVGMFGGAAAFDHDLSQWDVSNVTNMSGMFFLTSAFNQDLSQWDVSNVTHMEAMFSMAAAFDQDLSQWDVSNVQSMDYLFEGTTLSTQNYDAILNGWSMQSVQNGVPFHGGDSKYSGAAAAARQSLIDDHNWVIVDAGLE